MKKITKENALQRILFLLHLIHCFDWLSEKLKMSPGNCHHDVREVDELYSRYIRPFSNPTACSS
jgi:hypothetical protein